MGKRLKKRRKLLVWLGADNKLRFYDIVSIISLSVFANQLCGIFEYAKKADFYLLGVSFFAGVSLAFINTIYTGCHQRTQSEPNKKSYEDCFSVEVADYRSKLVVLWSIVVAVILVVVYCLLLKFNVIDWILLKFACTPKS